MFTFRTSLLSSFRASPTLAEGPPGVRILWPVQQTAWTASYWWFLGMIIVFTAARLILVTTCVPRTRVRWFQPPSPSRSAAHAQLHCMNLGDPFPDREPEASDSEGGSRNRLSRSHLPAGAIAAVTASSVGPAAAPDSTATTAGTHTRHNHCPAGSAGEHHSHDGSCTRGGDAPTSCRRPIRAERHVATPIGLTRARSRRRMLGTCGSAGELSTCPGV